MIFIAFFIYSSIIILNYNIKIIDDILI